MLAVDTHKLEGIVAVSLNTKAAGLVDQGAPSARRARGSLINYARISRFSSLLFASTFCVALLMTLSGIHKSLLGWKNGRRQCPSCGRQLRSGCTCR